MPALEELPLGYVLNGHYLVVEAIARGGIGTVYSAVDQRRSRAVALKVVRFPGAAGDERWRQKFLRGAEAASRLQHPNVLRVHDFGADEALGLVYAVMELLEGEDLASRIARDGRLSAAAALAVVSQAASGLAEGHRSGMVHGGVKPENLFLEQDAHGEVRIRVLDFGIAQAAFDEPALATAAAGPLSSPFAAPELRGGMPVTAAADVFSLAAVAIYLLTGQRPFTGEATMQPVEADAALGRLVGIPGVTPAVRDVLRRALAVDPHRRWTDADAFREALQAARGTRENALTASSLAAEPPISAPPPRDDSVSLAAPAVGHALHASAAYQSAAPPSSRRPAASGGAPRPVPGYSSSPPRKAFRAWAVPAVILALVAAGAALTLLRPREARAPDEPVMPAESATRHALPGLDTGDSLQRRPDSPGREDLARATPEAESDPGTPPVESVYELPEVEQLPRPLNRLEVVRWIQYNYPPELRDAGVQGNVQLRFVVDTAGRIESGSMEVMVRSHPEFERVAIDAAEQMRFAPARVGARPVRVRVELPFVFQIYQ